MKKITFLILFLTISFSVKAQFPENFDNGLPPEWTTYIGENGLGATVNWEYNDNGYMTVGWEAVTAGAVAEDWLVSPQVAITATNSLLIFSQTDANLPDYGSVFSVRVSTENSQTTHSDFAIVDTQTEVEVTDGVVAFSNHEVDLSAFEGQTIYIALVWTQNDGDRLYIDNLQLANQNASAPDCAVNPTPAIAATNVNIDVTNDSVSHSWELPSTGDSATSYDFFFGTTSGDLNLLGTFSGTSINITGVSYSTTYYWRVVLKNSGGDATGCSEWSYTTEDDPTLSIEKNKIEGLLLFPSLVDRELNFTSQKTVDVITIFNLLGQQVYNSKPNTENSSLDLSSLKKGVYIVKLISGNSTGSYKIIKE